MSMGPPSGFLSTNLAWSLHDYWTVKVCVVVVLLREVVFLFCGFFYSTQ